jgi:hypothetical protein
MFGSNSYSFFHVLAFYVTYAMQKRWYVSDNARIVPHWTLILVSMPVRFRISRYHVADKGKKTIMRGSNLLIPSSDRWWSLWVAEHGEGLTFSCPWCGI